MADISSVIDAAARAWFDRAQEQRRDDGRKRPDGQAWQWEDITEADRTAYRALVVPVVTAALTAVEAALRNMPTITVLGKLFVGVENVLDVLDEQRFPPGSHSTTGGPA